MTAAAAIAIVTAATAAADYDFPSFLVAAILIASKAFEKEEQELRERHTHTAP